MSETENLKIAIIGPGAIGCLLAHGLCLAGHRVTLIDYREDRAERINVSGINVINEDSGNVQKPFCSAHTESLPQQDLIILTVKAYNTREAAASAIPLISPETVILTLQNGMGYEHHIDTVAKNCSVAAGTTALGATLLEEGTVRLAGIGPTVIGFRGKAQKRHIDVLNRLAEAFNKNRWACSLVENPDITRWKKLMANIGINAITAISCLKNGEILMFPDARKLQQSAVMEAVAVMEQSLGVLPCDSEEIVRQVQEITRSTAENFSSMLQDRMRRARTEIDYINGFVCDAGRKYDISTPVNETLCRILRLLSASGWRTC